MLRGADRGVEARYGALIILIQNNHKSGKENYSGGRQDPNSFVD